MSARDVPSVTGGWLGTYAYGGLGKWQPPVRFEVTFEASEIPGEFTGTVLDEGPLGEASITGTQDGLQVRFTKVYRSSNSLGGQVVPVEYEGTLAEDGRSMKGTWAIVARIPGLPPLRTGGTWDAHRFWSEAAEPEALRENDARELVTAGR